MKRLMIKTPPLDPEEVFAAWQQLPGSREPDGLTVIEALRIAKKSPGECPRLIQILGKCAKAHRGRTLANALEKFIRDVDDPCSPRLVSGSRTVKKVRKLRPGIQRIKDRTRTPDVELMRTKDGHYKFYRVT